MRRAAVGVCLVPLVAFVGCSDDDGQTSCPRPRAKQAAFLVIQEEYDIWNALYSVRADGTVIRRLIPDMNVSHARFSPDGSQVVFTSQGPHQEGWGIFVVNADGTGRHTLFESSEENGWGDPAWSPDGHSVAVVQSTRRVTDVANRRVRLIVADLDDRKPVEVFKEHERGAKLSGPAWSPDGHRIAFERSVPDSSGREQSSIWVVNTDGSDAHVLVKDVHLRGQIGWSPDGRFLAFTSEDGPNRTVSTYDFTSQRVELRSERAWAPLWSADGDLVYSRWRSPAELSVDRVVHDLVRDESRVIDWKGSAGPVAANPCGPVS